MQGSQTIPFVSLRRITGVVAVSPSVLGCAAGEAGSPAGNQSDPSAAPGESPASTSRPADSTAPSPESTSPPADPAVPGGDLGGAALKSAVVTIGPDRYEFTEVRCDIFAPRYIQAGNYGGDPEVIILLPPEGWESEGDTYGSPLVAVKIGDEATDGVHWVAGDDGWFNDSHPAGKSQIDSYSVPDGRPVQATGTATFSDQAAILFGRASGTLTGSFEVTCL